VRVSSILWRLLALDSRDGRARGALRFWDWWERLSEHIWPIPTIPGSSALALRMRLETYRGQPVVLPDGTTIRRGDRIGALHLNNVVSARIGEGTPWPLEAAIMDDLRALASWVETLPPAERPPAFHGRTMFSRAARRMGFATSRCPRTPYILLFRFYLHGLMIIHSREGWRRMTRSGIRKSFPGDIWLSTGELLRRYGFSVAAEIQQPTRSAMTGQPASGSSDPSSVHSADGIGSAD
jgi:hypothetical protein